MTGRFFFVSLSVDENWQTSQLLRVENQELLFHKFRRSNSNGVKLAIS